MSTDESKGFTTDEPKGFEAVSKALVGYSRRDCLNTLSVMIVEMLLEGDLSFNAATEALDEITSAMKDTLLANWPSSKA